MAYSSISKPSLYFNTKLYTGNGSTNAITGVGFQPDFLWIKQRSEARSHQIMDAVRGASYRIKTDATEAQSSSALTSFNSDGFTVDGTSLDGTNKSSGTYASWNWKANGTGSANTDGSINSTVSANTTAGFSIVSYTGTGANATVGHGLGAVPSVIIIKDRDNGTGYNWRVYHHKNTSAPETDVLVLNLTNATNDNVTYWNDTAPTSSVFTIGTDLSLNNSGDAHIAYCFAEKKGYSKFGSYTGNGNADGTFVYTGFKPAWVMVKQTNASGNSWHIKDNKRSSFNVVDDSIYANSNIAEVANNSSLNTDFLSNGFKLKNTDGSSNGSGSTYIYMAFAEEPLVANVGASIPATAR